MSTHRPQRTCLGCKQVDDQSQLLRWVVDAQDPTRVLPDPTRRKSGRGAWLHPTPECVQQAARRRAFSRAFRSASVRHDVDELLSALSGGPPRDGYHTEKTPESGSQAVETR